MDDRTVDLIFSGSLENLPPVSSKIVRIFTSSTFTGMSIIHTVQIIYKIKITVKKPNNYYFQIPQWKEIL